MLNYTDYGTLSISPEYAKLSGISNNDIIFLKWISGDAVCIENEHGIKQDKRNVSVLCKARISHNLAFHRQTAHAVAKMNDSVIGTFRNDITILPTECSMPAYTRDQFIVLMNRILKNKHCITQISTKQIFQADNIRVSLYIEHPTATPFESIFQKIEEYIRSRLFELVISEFCQIWIPKYILNTFVQPGNSSSLPVCVKVLRVNERCQSYDECAKTNDAFFKITKNTKIEITRAQRVFSPKMNHLGLCKNVEKLHSYHRIQAINILRFYFENSSASTRPFLLLRAIDKNLSLHFAKSICSEANIPIRHILLKDYIAESKKLHLSSAKKYGHYCAVITDASSIFDACEFTDDTFNTLKSFISTLNAQEDCCKHDLRHAVCIATDEIHHTLRSLSTIDINLDDVTQPEPSVSRNNSAIYDCSQKCSDNELYGLDAVVRKLEITFRLPYVESKLPIRHPHGILLYGPPGCGKTSIIRHFAASRSLPVKHLDCSSIFSSYVGESERLMRKAFAEARLIAPCILFVDEVEAVGGHRSSERNDTATRLLSVLLAEIDGVTQSPGVIFIGATNAPNLIDEALMRPGRFDLVLEIPLPNMEARKSMIASILLKSGVKECETKTGLVEYLTGVTSGCSGASIQSFIFAAIAKAVNRVKTEAMPSHSVEVSADDFDLSHLR